MNQYSILDAMKIIQQVCMEGKPAGVCMLWCPFYHREKECYIKSHTPNEWEIGRVGKMWRAYKEE